MPAHAGILNLIMDSIDTESRYGVKMKKMLLILLVCSYSFIHADEPVKTGVIDTFGKEYIPYNEKLVLVYKSNFDETLSKTDIANNSAVLENKADNFIYRQKYEMHEDGLYISETYQKIKVLLFFRAEKKVTYNKDLLKIPYPVKTGQQWTCERTEYCDGDSNKVSLSAKCIGSEEITTEAGKFMTMKLETNVKSQDGSTNIVEEWIAPNVGIVKLRARMFGGGLTGTIRDLLGLGELNFELKQIKNR